MSTQEQAMPEDLARRIVLGSRDEYAVQVEGVGEFACRRRSFFDDARIELEAQKYLQGLGVMDVRNVLPSLEGYARMYGTVKVSVSRGPQGWSLEDASATDDILRVYGAIEAEEASFRASHRGARAGDAPGQPAPGAPVGVPDVPPASFARGHRRADG